MMKGSENSHGRKRQRAHSCARCHKGYTASAAITQKATYCPTCLPIHMAQEQAKRSRHQMLAENYFQDIDSKDKAYWLGFLYADGYISVDRGFVSLELCKKDTAWVKRWADAIGGNFECRYERLNPKNGAESVQLRICNRTMVVDLVWHGCLPNKSMVIRLPEFGEESLDLAFLMGYFDGDGSAADTSLVCGSLDFLKDIVSKYAVPNKIRMRGSVPGLTLGSELFKRMLANYPNSMPRKRATHVGQYQWFNEGLLSDEPGKYDESLAVLRKERSLAYALENADRLRKYTAERARKFIMDLDLLKEEVWKKSTEQIGREHGVTGAAVAKVCRRHGIDKPGRGYWAKKASEDARTKAVPSAGRKKRI